MRVYELIQKKRNGGELTDAEIRYLINGYVAGEIPDYQMSALCMAIWFRGMTASETVALTFAIRDSGEILHLEGFEGFRVDKHSTGGVGDKTSLIVAPIVASLGIRVAKMSGRGLGHTGGTVDKLESIKGFCTTLSTAAFQRAVDEAGIAIVGQNADLAPADKLLYALRDVTATVDSIPLIASSIMGKKLAANDDGIVLDVKTGSGAFMKTPEESRALAKLMVEIGTRAGKKMCALITDMDRPLGNAIGNSLEVVEAIETLMGNGPKDLYELSVALSAHMLYLAGHGELAFCEREAKEAVASGRALEKLADMVRAQGGDPAWIYHPEHFPKAAYTHTVYAPRTGCIERVDAEGYGTASLLLGAGRKTKEDTIDLYAGIMLAAKTGDRVEKGAPLAVLHASDPERFPVAEERILSATVITDRVPQPRPLIFEAIHA